MIGTLEIIIKDINGKRISDGGDTSYPYPDRKDILDMTADEIVSLLFGHEDFEKERRDAHRVEIELVPAPILCKVFNRRGDQWDELKGEVRG